MSTQLQFDDVPLNSYGNLWLKRCWFWCEKLKAPVFVKGLPEDFEVGDGYSDKLVCYVDDKGSSTICPIFHSRTTYTMLSPKELDITRPQLGYTMVDVAGRRSGKDRRVAVYLEYTNHRSYKRGLQGEILRMSVSPFQYTSKKDRNAPRTKDMIYSHLQASAIFIKEYNTISDALRLLESGKEEQQVLGYDFAVAKANVFRHTPHYKAVLLFRGHVVGYFSRVFGGTSAKVRLSWCDGCYFLKDRLEKDVDYGSLHIRNINTRKT